MKIPIHCEHCGEFIATFDTAVDTSCEWAEAPCGEKVCEQCCEECAKQHDPHHTCMFRREEGGTTVDFNKPYPGEPVPDCRIERSETNEKHQRTQKHASPSDTSRGT